MILEKVVLVVPVERVKKALVKKILFVIEKRIYTCTCYHKHKHDYFFSLNFSFVDTCVCISAHTNITNKHKNW